MGYQALYQRTRWTALAGKAMDNGGSMHRAATGAAVLRWNAAGNCSAPVYRQLVTADYPHRSGYHLDSRRSLIVRSVERKQTIEIMVRCRKCVACLRTRAFQWRIRAIAEINASSRTWFGTLTLKPEEHFAALGRARLRLDRQGIDFDALNADERFAEHHRQISPLITKYVKRVRKECGGELRLICVAEAHKSGWPHYHLLVHEVGAPVRHKTLSAQWSHGFSKFNLVTDKRAAFYVCKYLTKGAGARVRASVRYGIDLDHSSKGLPTAQEREPYDPTSHLDGNGDCSNDHAISDARQEIKVGINQYEQFQDRLSGLGVHGSTAQGSVALVDGYPGTTCDPHVWAESGASDCGGGGGNCDAAFGATARLGAARF